MQYVLFIFIFLLIWTYFVGNRPIVYKLFMAPTPVVVN